MAWSAPRTWVTGELITAAIGNTHWRDEFKYLGGADGRGTSLPASPVDGQRYWFVANAATFVVWSLIWDAASAKWWKDGGPPLRSTVSASQTIGSSAAWVDLATPGPSVTAPITMVFRAKFGALLTKVNAQANDFRVAIDVAGTRSSEELQWNDVNAAADVLTGTWADELSAASGNVIKLLYYATWTGTGVQFGRRFLEIDPVYVT